MPEANINKNLLKGTWGAQFEWYVSLMKVPDPLDIGRVASMIQTMHKDRLIALFRFSFDPLPDDNTPGTLKFYSTTNHGGSIKGKIVNGVGDFNSAGGFNPGRYSINADGATGWLTVGPVAGIFARFSFVITNKANELLLSLTELLTSVDAPPTPPPTKIDGQAWGVAKRD